MPSDSPLTFVNGIIQTLNKLHFALPPLQAQLLAGYGTDVLTSHGFNYQIKWNTKLETYEAKEIPVIKN